MKRLRTKTSPFWTDTLLDAKMFFPQHNSECFMRHTEVLGVAEWLKLEGTITAGGIFK